MAAVNLYELNPPTIQDLKSDLWLQLKLLIGSLIISIVFHQFEISSFLAIIFFILAVILLLIVIDTKEELKKRLRTKGSGEVLVRPVEKK